MSVGVASQVCNDIQYRERTEQAIHDKRPLGAIQDRTHDVRVFRTLSIIDEFTREALVVRVEPGSIRRMWSML